MADPVCVATASVTVPGPVPFAPSATVIHEVAEEAVQEQSAPVVTVTGTDEADADTDTPLLDNVAVQALPVCDTVNVRPAIVIVPFRVNAVLLGATAYWTRPSPSPGDPDVTVIQATFVVADHPQPAVPSTVTEPVPPKPPSEIESGDSVSVHATPACVTVTVCPAIVTIPVRAALSGLLATLKDTDPTPMPVAPDAIVIHGTELVAVHGHVPPVLTVTVRNAGADVSEMLVCDSTVEHVGAACVTV